uniref:Uncharacterized protein n=1 Tax=Myoviridae sp. ctJ2i1 TaxID=2825079 RepID=A0A8S5V1S6_9CAUD|nr:MAG TPA: hypothetical protein [Myoviridae sp. ctJ2i1]
MLSRVIVLLEAQLFFGTYIEKFRSTTSRGRRTCHTYRITFHT